jgi:serine carboxypeptidase-like clade 2
MVISFSMLNGIVFAFLFSLQVGGWTQVFGKTQLSFASIRGASHTAPQTQPRRSFALFTAFLAGKPLSKA